MIRYESRITYLAAGLAALAGFVDAVGYLNLGGYFVSFMSGNTTLFAVGLAGGARSALIAGGLIAVFVIGVISGTLIGHFAGKRRASALLICVATLLAIAAALGMAGHMSLAAIAIALAMGTENAIFADNDDVHIGLTYMTGTLVKMGQRLAGAMLGRARFAWWPYLALWLGLASGAVMGAIVYPLLGLNALWLAALAALLFALLARNTNLNRRSEA
tara:strand:- start:47545 stop:48195 length:651 start_codon:yes stop_codon:yes gene_type:complete